MIGFVNIIKIVLWFIFVPFILGLLFESLFTDDSSNNKNSRFLACFPAGYAVMLAVFQVLSVPMVARKVSFHILKNAWLICILLIVLFSIYVKRRVIIELIHGFKSLGKGSADKKANSKNTDKSDIKTIIKNADIKKVLLIATLCIIAFQTWLLVFHMHTDTDDVRFVSEALEAYENDTMLKYHPIQGVPLDNPEGEMVKDMSSTFPFFIAVMSAMISVVPAITAHLIFPLFLIPLCYVVAYFIGDHFFKDKNLSVFMFLFSILVLFSFESIYSFGYTLLTIIWQGRSIAATIMLPFLWLLLMKESVEDVNRLHSLLELTVYIACANLSGMGIISALLLGSMYALNVLFIKRNAKVLVLHVLVMLPNLVYFMYYYSLGNKFMVK